MNNAEKLLKLVAEHPDLPVVLLVDSDAVGEDYCRYRACFGEAYIGEYAEIDDRYFDDREEFKEYFADQYMRGLEGEELEKRLDECADELFEKVIIVNIDSLGR